MEAHFSKIIEELERRPLLINRYRKNAGRGRSQTFGVVNRRSLPPDYSRLCWDRPQLYSLLLDFGTEFVKINFNSITLNQNYQCGAHRDKNNNGESALIAFGDFVGGELEILEGESMGVHNIKHRFIQCDFSRVLHCVLPFSGDRYSLVYYQTETKPPLPPPSVRHTEGKHVFYRGESSALLEHPLRKNKQKVELPSEH